MLDALLANQLVKAVAARRAPAAGRRPRPAPERRRRRRARRPAALRAVPRHPAGARLPPGRGLGDRRERPAGQRRRDAALRRRDHRLLLPAGRRAGSGAAAAVVDLVAERLPRALRLRAGRGPGALADAPRRGRRRARSTRCSRSGSTPGATACPRRGAAGASYRPGDRVLQLRNDYDLEVFNGDLGHGARRSTRPSRSCCCGSTTGGRCATRTPACSP